MKFFQPAAGWLARDVAKAAERAKELEARPRWRCRCGRLAAIKDGWRSGLVGCPNYSGRAAHLGDTCKFLPPPLVCKCGASRPCPYPGCWHPEKTDPPTKGGWVDKDGQRVDGCSPYARDWQRPPSKGFSIIQVCVFIFAAAMGSVLAASILEALK